MPRRNISNEKAKDFKKSIKRLLKELNPFKILIIIGLILAFVCSVFSILAPNKISDLVNEISNGLKVNEKNITLISENITNSLNNEKLYSILNIDLSEQTILEIMNSTSITESEKELFNNFLNDKENITTNIKNLPNSILEYILKDTNYNNIVITQNEKIDLIKNMKISSTLSEILFSEFSIDNTIISKNDQAKFINIISSASSTDVLNKLDKLPKSIKSVIEPKFNMKQIKKIVLFLILLYVFSALFSYIEHISMTIVSNNFANRLRSRISNKINKLPLKYFDKNQIGDILSRVTNDVDTISQSMNQSFATLVSAISLLMFKTNYIMALTAIISSLIGFSFMFIVLAKSQKYFIKRQKYLGEINSHIEEIYSSLNVVKTYNGKESANNKFDKLNNEVYEANRKSQFLSGLMMPIMNFIGNFGYVAVCIVGAILTMRGSISFGVIVAFMTYVRLFTSPLSQIGQAMTSLQTTAASSERVFEFLDEKEMDDEESITKVLDKSKVKGNIEFKNVVFSYDKNKEAIIKNFNVEVKSGQKVAIVGPTGAGKTTMVNLLMKFYEIDSGDIIIDGISINDLRRSNIHELFTMVLQDTWVFEGTIKDNIIYNRKNIPMEKVKEVCEVVGIDHFINTLPNTYDSILKENDNISSGQRQLLTIARGMIEDAPFLILDEATSNVDTRTEELVQKAMDKLTEGRTSFIIAHRLSTIKNADLILVMKDGNIIEKGTHDELINQNGFYKELYNSQFEN